jgi:hypothetical protein
MSKKFAIPLLIAAVMIICPSEGKAQVLTTSEIGLTIGTMTTKNKVFRLHIPGRGVNGSSGIYLTYFYKPQIMLTPRFEIGVTHFDRTTNTVIGLDGQIAYLFKPFADGSPYFGGGFTLLMNSWENSSTIDTGAGISAGFRRILMENSSTIDTGAGISAGFRRILMDVMGLRFEVRYQRWLTAETNELIFSVGIGAIFRSN